MNVVQWLLVLFCVGAFGGIIQGFMTFDGFIFPDIVKRNIQVVEGQDTRVTMFAPGVVGQMLVGGVAGVLVFCIYSQPAVNLGWSTHMNITLYQFGTVLLAGVGGSVAIKELVEKKQWQKLAPVLKAADPATDELAGLRTMRPVEAFKSMGTRAT